MNGRRAILGHNVARGKAVTTTQRAGRPASSELGTIATYALIEPRSSLALAGGAWVLGLAQSLLPEVILVAAAFGAARRVSEGDLRDYRVETPDQSGRLRALGLTLAVLFAAASPGLILSIWFPSPDPWLLRAAGVALGRGAAGIVPVAYAQSSEGPWEFGDFGTDGASSQPPPKAGVDAENEAREYEQFEERYAARERLRVDPEEDEEDATAGDVAGEGGAAWAPASSAASLGRAVPLATPTPAPPPAGSVAAATNAPTMPVAIQLMWMCALVWYCAYPPIALAVAVRSESIVRTLDPVAGLELVISMGPAFLKSLAICGLIVFGRVLLGELLGQMPVVGGFARASLDAYSWLAVGCTLGLAMRAKAATA